MTILEAWDHYNTAKVRYHKVADDMVEAIEAVVKAKAYYDTFALKEREVSND